MTNEEIIERVAIELYGEEKVRKIIQSGYEIPLHTLIGWNQRSGGRLKVRKGEHGIETKLWKLKKNRKSKQDSKDNIEDEEDLEKGNYYLCKAYLFTASQVEPVKGKGEK